MLSLQERRQIVGVVLMGYGAVFLAWAVRMLYLPPTYIGEFLWFDKAMLLLGGLLIAWFGLKRLRGVP